MESPRILYRDLVSSLESVSGVDTASKIKCQEYERNKKLEEEEMAHQEKLSRMPPMVQDLEQERETF